MGEYGNDFNNAKDLGLNVYHCGVDNVSNGPKSTTYGTLISAVNGFYGLQVYMDANAADSNLYLRQYIASRNEWGVWKKITFTPLT